MRGSTVRRRHEDEEEESSFVSMTDMTVGFLFIVILLLAYFASQYDPSTNVPLTVHDRVLAERDQARADVQALEASLKEKEMILSALRQELLQAREIITGLQTDKAELATQIANLQVRIEKLEAELARLRAPDLLETYC